MNSRRRIASPEVQDRAATAMQTGSIRLLDHATVNVKGLMNHQLTQHRILSAMMQINGSVVLIELH
jgi:hypothetical protein